MNKIVHLHFKESNKDYYFGSIIAIYELFSTEDINISYFSLMNVIHKRNDYYENDICSIRIAKVIKKKKATINGAD